MVELVERAVWAGSRGDRLKNCCDKKMFVEIDLTKVFFKSVSYKNIFRK